MEQVQIPPQGITQIQDQGGPFALLIITLIFVGIIVGFSAFTDIEKVKQNWPEYRCRPDVMFMAGLYGHDAAENIEFCLRNGFEARAKQALGPVYEFLGKFTTILLTLLNSINSIRMIFATIVGSVTRIFSEFSQRLQAFFYSVQTSIIRIKFLMSRVFAMVFAIIYMAMSGLKAVTNFGNTFLFSFLDTFCFDPDTPITTLQKGIIPIREVEIGDQILNSDGTPGPRVTATFQFFADGQPMVKLNETLVSTNHYVYYEGGWRQAKDHPLAQPIGPWQGGVERPLICLNTDTHTFPIRGILYRDYDETSAGDAPTMQKVDQQLNGNKAKKGYCQRYDTCCGSKTKLRGADGEFIPVNKIQLGTYLTHGKVVGIVKKECSEVCSIDSVELTPGTSVWSELESRWVRAGDLTSIQELETPTLFYSFVVTPSACIETESGLMFRDYVEIHSPDTELEYTKALTSYNTKK